MAAEGCINHTGQVRESHWEPRVSYDGKHAQIQGFDMCHLWLTIDWRHLTFLFTQSSQLWTSGTTRVSESTVGAGKASDTEYRKELSHPMSWVRWEPVGTDWSSAGGSRMRLLLGSPCFIPGNSQLSNLEEIKGVDGSVSFPPCYYGWENRGLQRTNDLLKNLILSWKKGW